MVVLFLEQALEEREGEREGESPPRLAASTASDGSPNWLSSGPSWPEAKALLNILMAWRRREGGRR